MDNTHPPMAGRASPILDRKSGTNEEEERGIAQEEKIDGRTGSVRGTHKVRQSSSEDDQERKEAAGQT